MVSLPIISVLFLSLFALSKFWRESLAEGGYFAPGIHLKSGGKQRNHYSSSSVDHQQEPSQGFQPPLPIDDNQGDTGPILPLLPVGFTSLSPPTITVFTTITVLPTTASSEAATQASFSSTSIPTFAVASTIAVQPTTSSTEATTQSSFSSTSIPTFSVSSTIVVLPTTATTGATTLSTLPSLISTPPPTTAAFSFNTNTDSITAAQIARTCGPQRDALRNAENKEEICLLRFTRASNELRLARLERMVAERSVEMGENNLREAAGNVRRILGAIRATRSSLRFATGRRRRELQNRLQLLLRSLRPARRQRNLAARSLQSSRTRLAAALNQENGVNGSVRNLEATLDSVRDTLLSLRAQYLQCRDGF